MANLRSCLDYPGRCCSTNFYTWPGDVYCYNGYKPNLHPLLDGTERLLKFFQRSASVPCQKFPEPVTFKRHCSWGHETLHPKAITPSPHHVLSLANAHCFFMRVDPDATHCQDESDGSWHAVGSSWISNCMNCTCFSCCSTYAIPWIFPEEDCESVFDNSTCEYIVRRKDDPSVLCPVTGAVGK
ncbi:hypothetical protein OJAV_G00091310 [Oryzias javanicus]|uniref:Uncharacterized protein n=1 Tax=Oryzias javanicus TaxID=123683 RepID=A0A3S2P7B7_ORYJA|nr:hypothetical protein OJAV_G00091310 [Oryzias javanicus]